MLKFLLGFILWPVYHLEICLIPKYWGVSDHLFLFLAVPCGLQGLVSPGMEPMTPVAPNHQAPGSPSGDLLSGISSLTPAWSPGIHCMMCESDSHSVVSDSLQPHGLYSPWNSPGQNTGVGSLSLFQGVFPTQGLNPGLPHCGRILYQLSHQGSLRILEWVAYLFSSRSSQPRNQAGVSCIAGRFFTN